MTDQEILTVLQQRDLKFMQYLGGGIVGADKQKQEAVMVFEPGDDLCHSGNVIQGGFLTAMLDAAMAHAVMVASEMTLTPPTLELKISFLKPGLPGPHRAVGRVVRMGKSVGFLEGELYNVDDELIAKSSATARLVPAAPVS